jgi:hypothetical protein
VLNSSSVFQLNLNTKLNICASISATSASHKKLCISLVERTEKQK